MTEPDWPHLTAAYGPAHDIPDLLTQAKSDSRSAAIAGTPWFKLWSALCHQGDVFDASYAAVPKLIEVAHCYDLTRRQDPVFLIGCIELARLEGHGPPIPPHLAVEYAGALEESRRLTAAALSAPLDSQARSVLTAVAAALANDAPRARALLDAM